MNRGRRSTPTFLATLTEALGEAIPHEAFVSLTETDRILESFRQGYQAAVSEGVVAYRKFFAGGQAQHVFRMAERLAAELPTEAAYLMTKMSDYCGAVSLPLSTLLRHAGAIIRLDGDSLSVISLDHKEGLLIDYNRDDEDQNYEVTIWGNRWPIAVLSCSTD
jgi:hypothetical protein